jgi:hypothetical protein
VCAYELIFDFVWLKRFKYNLHAKDLMEQEAQLTQDIAELLAVLKNTQETTRLQEELFAKLDLLASQNTQILAHLTRLSEFSKLPPLISPQDLFSQPQTAGKVQTLPTSQIQSQSLIQSQAQIQSTPTLAPTSQIKQLQQSQQSPVALSSSVADQIDFSLDLAQPLELNSVSDQIPDSATSLYPTIAQAKRQQLSQQTMQQSQQPVTPTSIQSSIPESQLDNTRQTQIDLQPPTPPPAESSPTTAKKTTRSTFGSWFS